MERTYIYINNMDFWLGISGYGKQADWEDVCVFSDKHKQKSLGNFRICTKTYFESLIDTMPKDSFYCKVMDFLEENEIVFDYGYDSIEEDDIYDAAENEEENSMRVKPYDIEIWYPAKYITEEILKECSNFFMSKFLGYEAKVIEYIDKPTSKEIYSEFIKNIVYGEPNSN